MREIRSADNARFKRALKLRDSARERRKSGLTFLDGVHLVHACVVQKRVPHDIFVSRAALADVEVSQALAGAGIDPLVLGESLFAKLSSVTTPTGVVAIVDTPRPKVPPSPGACVLLEDVQDPGNVGSILRSTAGGSIEEIYLSRGCADAWSPRVLRAAMGAHFALRIFEDVDVTAFVRGFRGRLLAAAADGVTAVFDSDVTGIVALAFGNEGSGLTRAVRDAAHATISVPISERVESLNVAAAAAVILFERVRQESARVTQKG